MDCGKRVDPQGTWHGDSTYGGEYTLTCMPETFVSWGDSLQEMTVSCSKSGRWPADLPRCLNAWQEARDAEFATPRWWGSVACVTTCVAVAALAAGLTMGLVSLQDFEMRVLMATRPEDCTSLEQRELLRKDQRNASRVLPLLSDRHLLLVTLLLLNSLANEALPIFLDRIAPAYVAILISVSCVLFFGEILPSAAFTGPSQLAIAASFAPLVRLLELVFWVVARPIASVLDHLVGHQEGGPKYRRAELEALLHLHQRKEPVSQEAPQEAPQEALRDPAAAGPALRTEGRYIEMLPLHRKSGNDGSKECEPQAEKFVEKGLHPLECSMAQRCLKLSQTRLSQLRLDALAECPHGVRGGGPQLRTDMLVVEALEALLHAAPGSVAEIRDAGGLPGLSGGSAVATASLESLLRAAILPPGPLAKPD